MIVIDAWYIKYTPMRNVLEALETYSSVYEKFLANKKTAAELGTAFDRLSRALEADAIGPAQELMDQSSADAQAIFLQPREILASPPMLDFESRLCASFGYSRGETKAIILKLPETLEGAIPNAARYLLDQIRALHDAALVALPNARTLSKDAKKRTKRKWREAGKMVVGGTGFLLANTVAPPAFWSHSYGVGMALIAVGAQKILESD